MQGADVSMQNLPILMASQINVISRPDPMTPMNPFSTTQKLPADVSRIVYIRTHEVVRKRLT